MLYIVGLGLGSAGDVTVNGLNTLKKSKYVYLDAYTSIIPDVESQLRLMCNKDVVFADREMIEQSNEIIEYSKDCDVSLVVVGDPLCATTHTSLIIRAVEEGIPYKILHNASIMTAVGCSGLQLYNFGITVTVPFWDEFGKPESFFDNIERNFLNGFHTLCLLDIKVKEKSLENLMRCRDIYEPPRFMTCRQAVSQINEILRFRSNTSLESRITSSTLVIGLARVGLDDQAIIVSTLGALNSAEVEDLFDKALGGPLHSMIIPGRIQSYESDFLLAGYTSDVKPTNLPVFIINPNQKSHNYESICALISEHNKSVEHAAS